MHHRDTTESAFLSNRFSKENVIQSHPATIDSDGVGAVLTLETQPGSTYNISLPAGLQVFCGGQTGTNVAESVPMTGVHTSLIATAWDAGGGFIGTYRADARAPASSNFSPVGFYANVSSRGTALTAGPYGINAVTGSAGGQNGFGAYIEIDDFDGAVTASANNVGIEVNVQTKSSSLIAGINIAHVKVSGGGNADLGTAVQVGDGWQIGVKFLQGATAWPMLLFDSLTYTGFSGLYEVLNTPNLEIRKPTAGTRATGINAPNVTAYGSPITINDSDGAVFLGGNGGSASAGDNISLAISKNNGGVAIGSQSYGGKGTLTVTSTVSDTSAPILVDASGSTIDGFPAIYTKLRSSGGRRVLQAINGSDSATWLDINFGAGQPVMGMGAGGSSAIDASVSRQASKTIAIGNGSAGDSSGTILSTIARLQPLTFSTLPTPTGGMIAYITDNNTTTWGANAGSGGSGHTIVWYNGSNWTVMGK